MPVVYTDDEIQALVAERKSVVGDWNRRVVLRQKRGHREGLIDLVGEKNNEFRILLRRSKFNVLDFSAIIMVMPSDVKEFRLRRYNGKSHEHTNAIEGDRFYEFHIHYATERYQERISGRTAREDDYAEPTDRYGDYQGALDCLITDMNVDVPEQAQMPLFPEV